MGKIVYIGTIKKGSSFVFADDRSKFYFMHSNTGKRLRYSEIYDVGAALQAGVDTSKPLNPVTLDLDGRGLAINFRGDCIVTYSPKNMAGTKKRSTTSKAGAKRKSTKRKSTKGKSTKRKTKSQPGIDASRTIVQAVPGFKPQFRLPPATKRK